MKIIMIIFLFLNSWLSYSQFPVNLSEEFRCYRLLKKNTEINIALSDTLFHYLTFQDINIHYATGHYQLKDSIYLDFKMDTLKTLSTIRTVSTNSKIIFPPRFDKIQFELFSDTIYCTYKYSGKHKIYKVPLIKQNASIRQ
jgi:hypothetical protein